MYEGKNLYAPIQLEGENLYRFCKEYGIEVDKNQNDEEIREKALNELCSRWCFPSSLDSTLYFIRHCKGEKLHPFCDYFHVDKSGDDATIKEQLIEKVKQFAIEQIS